MKKVSLIIVWLCALVMSACQIAPGPMRTPTATTVTVATATTSATADGATATAASPTGTAPSGTDPEPADIQSSYPPEPDDAERIRGNFFVDSANLVAVSGSQGTVELHVEGSLPTPCNQPRVVIQPLDENRLIAVEIYTVVQTGQMCTQVIKPFSGPVATLQGLAPGKYTLVVNDQEMGEFTVN